MTLNNFIIDTAIVWDRVSKSIFEKPQAKPGRVLRVQVTNAGVIEDLTGYTLKLGWINPVTGIDGLDAFEVVDATKGIFELPYTTGMLSNFGSLRASLLLVNVSEETIAESNDFVIRVTASPFNQDASQSVGSWTALAEILLNEDERVLNEESRVQAETTRQQTFDALIDSEMIAQNVETKLTEKEATFAPRMLSLETQLADTLNKSAITLTHMFADNTARDAYFVANPSELMEQLFIKVGTGYQQYLSGTWSASSPIVAEQFSATNQPITDTGNYFATDNTNDALQELGAHKASTSNPHGVTKSQVGLGNADNTNDANKPISTATQAALNLKASKTQEAWITPTLMNGWIAFQPAAYFKDQFGVVHLKGILYGGTLNTICFDLPVGYRPLNNHNNFAIKSGSVVGGLNIRNFGSVTPTAGTANEICLDGITFRAEV